MNYNRTYKSEKIAEIKKMNSLLTSTENQARPLENKQKLFFYSRRVYVVKRGNLLMKNKKMN